MTRRSNATRKVPAVTDPDWDAKLIALGEQFEAIYKGFEAVYAEYSRLGREAHDCAHRRSGWWPDPEGRLHDSQLGERFLEELTLISKRNGYDAADKRLDAMYHQLDPIARDIMRTPASSLAGLRVKTLVAIFANGGLWCQSRHDLDWDKEAMRSVIEAACMVTGISVPQEQLDDGADDENTALSHPGSAALN